MIAALYVETDGSYFGLPNVIPWDKTKDARLYAGPYPVIAHPPCERWGVWAENNPNPKAKKNIIGSDEGCFESALGAVRSYGGVIEHPRGSRAWKFFNLPLPGKNAWGEFDEFGGRSCMVYQGMYGHLNPKPTWLYAITNLYPNLKWGKPIGLQYLSTLSSYKNKEDRLAARARGEKLPKRPNYHDRISTPLEFRDILISISEGAYNMKDAK